MNIIEINSCNYGSTGNIMLQIAEVAKESGDRVVTCIPKSRDNLKKKTGACIYIGGRISRNIHLMASKISGLNGCFSILPTVLFLRKIRKINPSIVHLHNLHNCYINLPLLFRYLKKNDIKVIWTLHDCWSFTGQCPYFTIAKCEKWKTGCHDCLQYRMYPSSTVDKTRTMWRLKKKWFTGLSDMIIVTPSEWLASLVRESFLKSYSTVVINNGIDLTIFQPTESDFRQRYKLSNKKILLGVAFGWGKRKGLDVFVELAKRLDERFQIVLVGTNDIVDSQLPDNIISIHRTHNQKELAELYTAADLLVNPTREENYPTVNMEAIACGTPVLTFRTGGSPEIPDDKTGYVVDVDDIDELEKQIERICFENIFTKEDCVERAKSFDKTIKFNQYVKLYRQ